jgi:hypothetical protein
METSLAKEDKQSQDSDEPDEAHFDFLYMSSLSRQALFPLYSAFWLSLPRIFIPYLLLHHMLGIMRYSFILGAVTPLALACDSTANDACHSALVASSASAASFCSTYTQSTKTATTGFPTFASACSLKHKKISSACSCLNGGTVVATTLATVTVG